MRLVWFPEPFQAYGSFAGEGARRVLGKPQLDPLTVLVRETAQNSWDARRPDRQSISFAFDGWQLTDEQLHLLRHDVFSDVPPAGIALGDVLDREVVNVLVVSDRGTVGLTGPVRADRPPSGRTDFIDLVFNMGQPRDVQGGGGTYGFGKTIAYIVSEPSTVLLYTRTRIEAELESRLIGVAVGGQYSTNERRYTGRHWWGAQTDETIGPITGSPADALAERLGFPSFEDDDTGLSMMILAPQFDRPPRQAMEFMAEALAWHFWPKLVAGPDGAEAPMQMRVSWAGEQIEVPDPEHYPPLDGFVQALRAIHASERGDEPDPAVSVQSMQAQRPNRQLGLLALHRMPYRDRIIETLEDEADDDDPVVGAAPFSGPAHHVALMRRVELVVKYLEGPQLPGPYLQWTGVFLNEQDTDPAFAEAEPPTHDDWSPGMVAEKSQRRLVSLALREIGRATAAAFAPAPAQLSMEQVQSGVVVANALGELIASTPGTGPGKGLPPGNGGGSGGLGGQGGGAGNGGSGAGGGGSPGTHGSVTVVAARPAVLDGESTTEVEVEVTARGPRTQVRGHVQAAIDGASPERDPPLGAPVPTIIGWRLPDATVIGTQGDTLTIDSEGTERWILVARNPAGTAVAVDVSVVTGGES